MIVVVRDEEQAMDTINDLKVDPVCFLFEICSEFEVYERFGKISPHVGPFLVPELECAPYYGFFVKSESP